MMAALAERAHEARPDANPIKKYSRPIVGSSLNSTCVPAHPRAMSIK